jgi:large subunit ribosomal protein L30
VTIAAVESEGHVRVTQVRSAIGSKPKHRATLRALGLRGVGKSRVLESSSSLTGMLLRVSHLVEVEPASADEFVARPRRSDALRARSGSATLDGPRSKAAPQRATSPAAKSAPSKAPSARAKAASKAEAPETTVAGTAPEVAAAEPPAKAARASKAKKSSTTKPAKQEMASKIAKAAKAAKAVESPDAADQAADRAAPASGPAPEAPEGSGSE